MSRQSNTSTRSGPMTTMFNVRGNNGIDDIVESLFSSMPEDVEIVDVRSSPIDSTASPRLSPRSTASPRLSPRSTASPRVASRSTASPRLSPRDADVVSPRLNSVSIDLIEDDDVLYLSPRRSPVTPKKTAKTSTSAPRLKPTKKSRARTGGSKAWKSSSARAAETDDYLDLTIRELLERFNLQPDVSLGNVLKEFMKSDPIRSMFE